MAATENKLKQRIVGALVLIALAVIFLPMLFKQEDPVNEVVVQAPPMPEAPAVPQFPVADVAVPEPLADDIDDVWDEVLVAEPPAQTVSAADSPIVATVPAPQPIKPIVTQEQPRKVITPQAEPKPVAPGIDKNNLPVSWSVQLASLTNKANAEGLRDTYRKKQYNAYVRSTDAVHRVLIGPLVKQTDAQAMCKRLKDREGQACFVVRYQP